MTKKLKIGVALGSGGVRGLAHIGVLKALIESGINPVIVTGTSVGAMIGGLYCALGSVGAVEDIFANITRSELLTMFSDITRGSGLIKGNNLEKFLDQYLKDLAIENLSICFAAVATNIHTAQDVVFTTGNLTKAIRASSSLPAVFNPFETEEGSLVDGGISQPVPIRAAKSLGADFVIAVNLDGYEFALVSQATKPAVPKIGFAALKLLRYRLSQELCKEANLVLEPDVTSFTWRNLADKKHRLEIIQKGYEVTIKNLPKLVYLQ
jgi:NTE family protein